MEDREDKAGVVEQALCDHPDAPPGSLCDLCGAWLPLPGGVALGSRAQVVGAGSVAIGRNASAGNRALAVGSCALAEPWSTAVGDDVVARRGEFAARSRLPWHRRLWALFMFPLRYLLKGDIRL